MTQVLKITRVPYPDEEKGETIDGPNVMTFMVDEKASLVKAHIRIGDRIVEAQYSLVQFEGARLTAAEFLKSPVENMLRSQEELADEYEFKVATNLVIGAELFQKVFIELYDHISKYPDNSTYKP